VATALPGPALEPGLEWVASTLSIAALLSEMKESAQRISELVAAIKSYSQMDRASMQQIDVADGIDSALVMLGHKLGTGISVVRDYSASVPRIQAYPGELNQVWTNLIDNALDAMNGAGTLRLATRAEEDDIVVEVGDTGPGMPPQIASRAFDASTSPVAQSWSATAASSPSTPGRATRCCGSVSPSGPPGAPAIRELIRSRGNPSVRSGGQPD
jgi:signal transduction histidine kinase